MKSFPRVLLCFVALASSALTSARAAAGSANLIRNGDFRHGLTDWNLPSNTGSPYAVESGPDGSAVLCYRNPAANPADLSFGQTVHFKAETYYRLTFRYQGDGQLAPMVLINDLVGKNASRRIFKLRPG